MDERDLRKIANNWSVRFIADGNHLWAEQPPMRGRVIIASGDPGSMQRLASVPAIISQLVAEVRARMVDREDPDCDTGSDCT